MWRRAPVGLLATGSTEQNTVLVPSAYSKRVLRTNCALHSELKSVHPGFPVAFIF